jgi:hypothetical protein
MQWENENWSVGVFNAQVQNAMSGGIIFNLAGNVNRIASPSSTLRLATALKSKQASGNITRRD